MYGLSRMHETTCVIARPWRRRNSLTLYAKLKRNFIATKRVAKSCALTLILLTWRKWWAPNNASKQHMGFNSAFKGLIQLQFLFCVHEGLPKRIQTESITKYTLIFIVFRCKPLLKQSFPSLWNGSSLCAAVGSTAGTDFFEPRVTRLLIIRTFPARPGNDLVHDFFLGHKKSQN
jgi:hypothetical protein